MSELYFYFEQGIFHILDLQGMDHMLFVCLLCARFQPREVKKLLIILTAFTIGHSISLLFTSMGYQLISFNTVEVLIPITIFLTAVSNLVPRLENKNIYLNYALATFFGLIHGMGFSNFFQFLMMNIDQRSIVMKVLAFNIGIELGQLLIVAVFLFVYIIYRSLTKGSHMTWKYTFSFIGILFTVWWLISA